MPFYRSGLIFPSLTDANLSFFKKSLLSQRRYHILFVGKSVTICDLKKCLKIVPLAYGIA